MKTPYVLVLALFVLAAVAVLRDRPPSIEETVRAGYQFHRASADDLTDGSIVHLTYWEKWNNFEGEAMQACVDAFNEHSRAALNSTDPEARRRFLSPEGRRIYVHLLSTTQVNQKAKLAVSGGLPPDVAGLWSRDVPVFAQYNAATPLDEFLKRDGPAPPEYQPCYWEMCVYEGHVWALPTSPSTVAMYWNKDLFREAGLDPDRPPRTLEELDAYNRKLTRRDESGRLARMGFHPSEPGWWNYGWGNWFGGAHATPDGRTLLLDSKEWVAAYTWLNKLAEDYGRSEMRTFKSGLGTFDSPQNAFISGKVAIVLQGVWMANYIRVYKPSMQWGVAPFPGPGGDAQDPVCLAQADVLVIPRGCKHPEEAWRFVRYVNSRGDPKDPDAPVEGMEILCLGQGKHTPFRGMTEAFQRKHPHEDLGWFIKLGESKHVYIEPMMPMWEEIRRSCAASYDELMSKGDQPGYGPQEVLTRLKNRLQPKLDQEWERIDRARKAGGHRP
ncbi:MAG: ABC transporter substrate-binding protein [Planctomycetota bacterium]|nr:ABC transporter substrate-binding protein [Planctomycetota bacterium]